MGDFDGGAFGAALLDVTRAVKGNPSALTFVNVDNSSIDDVHRAVWSGEYWAAITANSNSTFVSGSKRQCRAKLIGRPLMPS